MTVITQAQRLTEVESDHACGERQTQWISEPGGLTQFGAFVQLLPPGARSSIKHWHSAEDEMVYVLEGAPTLIEGESATLLGPGDAATFKAGIAIGHCLENRSARPALILVVGTRAAIDHITCPDHDRICVRERALPADVWTDMAGRPANNPYADPISAGEKMKIIVQTHIAAPLAQVWRAYTTPADIMAWNAASDDWHTTAASVDLREGGTFSARMEAKDGSFGFDFAGTYTKIAPETLIEYTFADREARVEFGGGDGAVTVVITFDAEQTHAIEQQRDGWQAILDRFKGHVEALGHG